MKSVLLLITLFAFQWSYAQHPHSHPHTHSRIIDFPDIPGYKTLACDFHIHTVFSDGSVWPDIRVQEALRDGLDAIALTEHLEYQPYIEHIPHPDRNRSHKLAVRELQWLSYDNSLEGIVDDYEMLIIHGAEITRDMPPGHSNAIFIKDANKLLDKDPMKVFEEANRQGAFVFWNHPNYIAQKKDGIAALTDMHRELLKKGWLHGIEVVNDLTYSVEALQIALDEGLTIVGTSDIHGLVDWQYDVHEGGHRPVMLVFSPEKSEKGIKEALVEGRTVSYFNDLLVGKEVYLKPLIESSLKINSAKYIGESSVLKIGIENISNAKILLKNESELSFHGHSELVEIPAKGSIFLEVKTLDIKEKLSLNFQVLNGIIAPKKHPTISLEVSVKE